MSASWTRRDLLSRRAMAALAAGVAQPGLRALGARRLRLLREALEAMA